MDCIEAKGNTEEHIIYRVFNNVHDNKQETINRKKIGKYKFRIQKQNNILHMQ